MNKIFILIDYKNRFSSKYLAKPYRSGLDKKILQDKFIENNFDVEFLNYTDINFRQNIFKNNYFFYTSSEDDGLFYKSYIEDILLGIIAKGGIIVPKFEYFRAHHNKVFMEILRDVMDNNRIKTIHSRFFGTIEDVKKAADFINYPVVVKSAAGAVSTGVLLAKDKSELVAAAKKFMKTKNFKIDLWDSGRAIKWKGYIKDSTFRNKIITQTYIPGLKEDWKILVFGKKYYVLNRKTRPNDFRASGSGLISYQENLPEGLLDFANEIFTFFNVPNMGMDIAFDGTNFHLIEFQFVSFGTHTLDTSPFYFIKENSTWDLIKKTSIVEEEFVNSIYEYIINQNGKL